MTNKINQHDITDIIYMLRKMDINEETIKNKEDFKDLEIALRHVHSILLEYY